MQNVLAWEDRTDGTTPQSHSDLPQTQANRPSRRSIYRADGSRTEILLSGAYGSEESKQAYERILSQLRVNTGKLAADQRTSKNDLTVAELTVSFLDERVFPYYVDPVTRKPTREHGNFRVSLRPLKRLYGAMPVSEFTPQSLCNVRQATIDGVWVTETEKKEWKAAGRKRGLNRLTISSIFSV